MDNELISRKALLNAMRKEDVLKVYECIQLVKSAPPAEQQRQEQEPVGYVTDENDFYDFKPTWLSENQFKAVYTTPPDQSKLIESQASEIAELKADRDEWKDATISANRRFEIAEQLNFEQKAHINELRGDLEYIKRHNKEGVINYRIEQALAATPAQYINNDVQIFDKKSLARHDDETIERCAKVVEEVSNNAYCVLAVDKIRALKAKP